MRQDRVVSTPPICSQQNQLLQRGKINRSLIVQNNWKTFSLHLSRGWYYPRCIESCLVASFCKVIDFLQNRDAGQDRFAAARGRSIKCLWDVGKNQLSAVFCTYFFHIYYIWYIFVTNIWFICYQFIIYLLQDRYAGSGRSIKWLWDVGKNLIIGHTAFRATEERTKYNFTIWFKNNFLPGISDMHGSFLRS